MAERDDHFGASLAVAQFGNPLSTAGFAIGSPGEDLGTRLDAGTVILFRSGLLGRYDNAPRLYDAFHSYAHAAAEHAHPEHVDVRRAATATVSQSGDAWATSRSATEHLDSRLARYGVISRVLDPARWMVAEGGIAV